MCTLLLATTVLNILSVFITGSSAARLTWDFADDEAALCNDFTRAGFFHRRGTGGGDGDQKWVVFLESGSLCYSSETCNRRYFQSHLRDRYSEGNTIAFGDFNTSIAWDTTKSQPRTQVVNPLMTSLDCFRNDTQFFSSSENLTVEGRDILSSDCKDNPTFCNHSHVLVPYCSSDLWLGSDTRLGNKTCKCWDQDCFRYNPTSEDLQFTFRGQTIFQSVLQTLDRLYNLQTASEIVLVGSSAGGVGVLNSVKWVSQTFQNVTLKVIADSSWFINFRDSINQKFGPITEHRLPQSNTFIEVIGSIDACTDRRLGYPCCLSARCLLTERNRHTGEPYYPAEIPLFLLQSLYDLFILTNSISRLSPVISHDLYTTASIGLHLVMTIGEYGGEMNSSLAIVTSASNVPAIKFSYFVTQCFQHVYFATSNLRDKGGLLGSEVIELSSDITTVRLACTHTNPTVCSYLL